MHAIKLAFSFHFQEFSEVHTDPSVRHLLLPGPREAGLWPCRTAASTTPQQQLQGAGHLCTAAGATSSPLGEKQDCFSGKFGLHLLSPLPLGAEKGPASQGWLRLAASQAPRDAWHAQPKRPVASRGLLVLTAKGRGSGMARTQSKREPSHSLLSSSLMLSSSLILAPQRELSTDQYTVASPKLQQALRQAGDSCAPPLLHPTHLLKKHSISRKRPSVPCVLSGVMECAIPGSANISARDWTRAWATNYGNSNSPVGAKSRNVTLHARPPVGVKSAHQEQQGPSCQPGPMATSCHAPRHTASTKHTSPPPRRDRTLWVLKGKSALPMPLTHQGLDTCSFLTKGGLPGAVNVHSFVNTSRLFVACL